MPKAKDKTKRRRIEELEDDHSSQSQRPGTSSQHNNEKDEKEVDCTQTGKSQKSQKELSRDELNRKVSELVRYLLFMDRKKYPIKRGDITKSVLKEHSKAFNQVFDHAKKNLQEVFGMDIEEIEVGKSKGYILVSNDNSEARGELIDWGDDLSKMGLLMVVLSLIFMSDHVLTESMLWHTLKKLGIEPKSEHEEFGDPDKLITQEFVRQCYLDRKKVIGGDEATYEYRWGPRAEKELTKRQVLQFVSEIASLVVAMTTYLATPPSYDLSVWPPQPTNDLYELWTFYSECPPELPLLTGDFLADLHNNGDADPMECIMEPNLFENKSSESDFHRELTPVANLPLSTPPPEPSSPYDTSISEPNQFHRTRSTSPPLQSTQAHLQIAQQILEERQDGSKVNFTSTKAEESIDLEEDKIKLPHDEKMEEQPEKSTDREDESKNEFATEVKREEEKLSSTDAELLCNDRPTRDCHSRYSFRSRREGSLHKQSRPTVRKTVVLWKFIKELLDNNDNCVSWISREERTFKFVDSKQAAKLWGQRKNKRNMTYEKMSRALRYYYDRQIMYHIDGQKLMYRFGDGARECGAHSVNDEDRENVAVAS